MGKEKIPLEQQESERLKNLAYRLEEAWIDYLDKQALLDAGEKSEKEKYQEIDNKFDAFERAQRLFVSSINEGENVRVGDTDILWGKSSINPQRAQRTKLIE